MEKIDALLVQVENQSRLHMAVCGGGRPLLPLWETILSLFVELGPWISSGWKYIRTVFFSWKFGFAFGKVSIKAGSLLKKCLLNDVVDFDS